MPEDPQHSTPEEEGSRLRPDGQITVPDFEESAPPGAQRWGMLTLVLGLAAASVAYHVLMQRNMDQTSLLFIGVPALLTIILAAGRKPKTMMGGVMRGVTLALLLSGVVLGEGFICIVMAAPLFYLVAVIVVGAVQWVKGRKARALSCVALILLPISFEGTRPEVSFARSEAVSATAVVEGTSEQVEERLARAPRVSVPLPFYLSLRFPRPTSATGEGLQVGSLRTVHFAGGHGMPRAIAVGALPYSLFTTHHSTQFDPTHHPRYTYQGRAGVAQW